MAVTRVGEQWCRCQPEACAVTDTPELGGRIKVVAFRCGVSVVDMLRAMLERGFPEHGAES